MTDAISNYKNQSFGVGDFALNGLHLAIRGGSLAMSYEARIQRARSAASRLFNLSSEQRKRVDHNLNLIFPDMSARWKEDMRDACFRNIGQSLMEHMHMSQFAERIGNLNISGEGVSHLDKDRGAILVSGHFGQWEGVRLAWRHLMDTDCAFFFRPNNNGFYDRHWQSYLRQAGEPIIAKGAAGKEKMGQHLAAKGPLLMVIDQRMQHADRFDFMGHPAKTATTAAELALEHNMPLIPAYGIRRDNLVDYDIVFEAPIDGSDPHAMTQALNASLGQRVFSHPDQYLWTHWRWK
jgi:KDO2-lipid IV(A) lauroyltransferase